MSWRKKLSDIDTKKLNSLKVRIQASRNIEEGKFPEINRLTNLIANGLTACVNGVSKIILRFIRFQRVFKGSY